MPQPPSAGDPSIQVVHDALAVTTAAIDNDLEVAHDIARHALAVDAHGFLDALLTTIQVLADEATEAGADPRQALREVGLGIHLAAFDEWGPSR